MAMTGYRLRQLTDRLEPGARLQTPLRAVNRVIYCHRGEVALSDGGVLTEDQAWCGAAPIAITAGADGAVLWRFDLDPEGGDPEMARGEGVSSELRIDVSLDGPDTADAWIMRCDSVKFPIGGCAFTHVHQGPGIRVLREGQLRIDTEGESRTYLPGQAWFEPGPEPVFAQASELECTRFIRVMILPEDLKGKSSIRYVDPDDFDKPKTQRYKGYVDEPIDH